MTSLKGKTVRAFDMVGWHPVQTEYSPDGIFYFKEDVDVVVKELLEFVEVDHVVPSDEAITRREIARMIKEKFEVNENEKT